MSEFVRSLPLLKLHALVITLRPMDRQQHEHAILKMYLQEVHTLTCACRGCITQALAPFTH